MEQRTIVRRYRSLDSTNNEARRRAGEGAPAWTVVVADTQTAGRGRVSRNWHSPAGCGLYFSVILRPRLHPAEYPKITIAAGVALCSAVESECALKVGLKWPNDLLLSGGKAGGVLTETGSGTGRGEFVILGIGLNVNTPAAGFPPELHDKATSLARESGRVFDRDRLLSVITDQLQRQLFCLEAGGFPEILNAWRRRDALAGRQLTWLTVAGELVRGEAMGIDDHGRYQVKDERGVIHQVLSGDLSVGMPE